jgi:hypothetical protein
LTVLQPPVANQFCTLYVLILTIQGVRTSAVTGIVRAAHLIYFYQNEEMLEFPQKRCKRAVT